MTARHVRGTGAQGGQTHTPPLSIAASIPVQRDCWRRGKPWDTACEALGHCMHEPAPEGGVFPMPTADQIANADAPHAPQWASTEEYR